MTDPTFAEVLQRLQHLEDTVTALTAKSDQWRAEAGAAVSAASDARRLASGASADLTDAEEKLRGHERVLQALRDTQVEQGVQLNGIEAQGRLTTSILTAIAAQLGVDVPPADTDWG